MKLLVQDESLLTKSFVKATLAQSQDEGLRAAQTLVADRFFADGTQVFDIRRNLAGRWQAMPASFPTGRSRC